LPEEFDRALPRSPTKIFQINLDGNSDELDSDLDSFMSEDFLDNASQDVQQKQYKSKEVPLIVRFKRLEQLVKKKEQMSKSMISSSQLRTLISGNNPWIHDQTAS
jgi:hypothetical protein